MGNRNKSEIGKTEEKAIEVALPVSKTSVDVRSRKEKTFAFSSIVDLVLFLEEKKPRRESIAYASRVVSSQVRERFLEKIKNHTDLYDFFQFFDCWIGWLEAYSSKNPFIRECFRECWVHNLGEELTWFSPLHSTFRMLEDTIPEWKRCPEEYRVLVPFAGQGVGSYFLREYFRAETLSSDKKINRAVCKYTQIPIHQEDSFTWIQRQDLCDKKIILFFAYPPRVHYDEGWGALDHSQRARVDDDPEGYFHGRQTDVRILDYVSQHGNLHWVIYVGCPNYTGSRAFHAYLNRRFRLRRDHTVRKPRHVHQLGEQVQVFQQNERRIRPRSEPLQRRLPTILEFMREGCNSDRSHQSDEE